MNRASRYGTTISTMALAAALCGCAMGSQSRESIFGSRVDHENIGVATRAQAALAANQFEKAVELAEKAVENTPNDAGFRSLLGNSYFAAGRFASAEAAYRDSLALIAFQPQVVLKLALVQIAQGKNAEAIAVLDFARGALDPADYGLAVALAGRPDAAIAVLNEAARMTSADGRVRQNLALAYGLSGDWTMARTVAAQDVPPDQLDSRIQQWMAMATPARLSDQVAALTGITPAVDPGQPQRLALKSAPQKDAMAQLVLPESMTKMRAQSQPQGQVQPAEALIVANSAPPALPEPMPEQAVAEAPDPAPRPFVPDPAVVAAAHSLLQPAPATEILVSPVEMVAAQAESTDRASAAPASHPPAPRTELPTKFKATPKLAGLVTDTARKGGRSYSVVQLGAYSSPSGVSAAWEKLTRRFPALADYTPMRARFDSSKGTVWRLSIKGFDSQREAIDRCKLLKSRGGSCFVRRVAGDSPVQFASR